MSEPMRDASDGSPYAGAVVVELVGEMDIASADQARAELARVISKAPRDLIVVDLAAVTFMDCGGLRVLVVARNSLGDRLILRRPSGAVTRLLDLADLRETFTLEAEQA
jgi:anti-sigma B factor antagonist